MLNSHQYESVRSDESNFAENTEATILCDKIENYIFKIIATYHGGPMSY